MKRFSSLFVLAASLLATGCATSYAHMTKDRDGRVTETINRTDRFGNDSTSSQTKGMPPEPYYDDNPPRTPVCGYTPIGSTGRVGYSCVAPPPPTYVTGSASPPSPPAP